MTPSPPSWAIAIARPDSVTVSIAALSSGTLSLMFRVYRVETTTSLGTSVECCGTSRTSSNVSAVERPTSVSVSDSDAVFSSMCQAPGVAPWHFLYFLPLPHGHGSFRPTFGSSRLTVLMTSSPPVRAGVGACLPAEDEDDLAAPANAGTGSAAGWFIVKLAGEGRRGAGRDGRAGGASAPSPMTGRSQKR